MIKTALFSILLLLTASPAFAESTATVNVKSNGNSSSYTNITVETNGKVTNYSSDKPGSVEVKAVNDQHEIKVNGEVIVTTGSPSKAPFATLSAEENEDEDEEEENKKEEARNIIEQIGELIKKLFGLF